MAATLPDYYINYPVYSGIMSSVEHFEWMIFTGILIAGVLLSAILGFIRFKNTSYTLRLLGINIFLDVALLVFISYSGFHAFLEFKSE